MGKWWFEVNGTRVSESDTYPIGQTHCISGADAGASDEDSLGCHVKAIWGKIVPCVEGVGKKTSSHKYGSQSSKRARYKCTKTTTLIECMFSGLEFINSDVEQMSGMFREGSSVVV